MRLQLAWDREKKKACTKPVPKPVPKPGVQHSHPLGVSVQAPRGPGF